MTTKAAFNAEEWSAIATAPALAAMYLSAADRGGTLREGLSASRAYANARAQQVGGLMQDVLSSPPTIASAAGQTTPEDLQQQAPAKLREAVQTLERHASDDEVNEYKRFVYSVADAVAHAHREGGFIGIGGKDVSEREQAALDEIAAIFDAPRMGQAPAADRARAPRTEFSTEEARDVGEALGIDWATAPFDVEQFRTGMGVELEHGLHDPRTNVTDDDPEFTGKIALAHLNEFPDYYTRLERMEDEAKRELGGE
ncbi:MAG: hypothetical protein QOF37_2774 [Thermoleophilaceae bacterium]|nr:hypothetical protein [Thermoleophilaceae bacterium]